MSEVTFKIDGKEKKAEEGLTILDVAKEMGIDIPTLCYSPLVSTFGACRVCSVKITTKWGRTKIVTACNYPVEDELVVETRSPEVIEIRKTLLELLLARCPKVKIIQDLAKEYGIKKTRFKTENEDETCILCGLCTRICEERVGVSAINFANRGITRAIEGPVGKSIGANLSSECVGCGACAYICPTGTLTLDDVYAKIRSTFPLAETEKRTFGKNRGEEDTLGIYEKCYAVKSKNKEILEGSQDGGAVTSLLQYALSEKLIDSAAITTSEDDWVPKAMVATNFDELKAGLGTRYTYYPSGIGISEAVNRGFKDVGFVGLPCQVGSLRRVITSDQPYILGKEKVKLLIGLFCMNIFKQGLMDYVKENVISLADVKKVDIKGGKLKIFDKKGELHTVPLKEISGYVNKGCHACRDYTAELADLSIGSVGSEPGWSTVFVRTDIGKEILEGAIAKGYVEAEEISDFSELVRLTGIKRGRADKEGY